MMTKTKTLAEAVKELAKAYEEFKSAEKRLKGDAKTKKNREPGLKELFFHEATQASMVALAKKTVRIKKETNDASGRDEALRRNPGWVAVSERLDGGEWVVVLEEDPNYKQFEYVDQENKLVWKKQITAGTAWIDDEKLRAADPKLWMRASEPTRVLKDLTSLAPKDLVQIQKYIYPGVLQIKLAAPRKAKPEELDD